MTVKTTDLTIKAKRKKHPNEPRYSCRPCIEIQEAIFNLTLNYSVEETIKLYEGKIVHDEDITAELFDEIKVGDIIGCSLVEKNNGWVPGQWVVEEIGDDVLHCKHRYEKKRKEDICFEDISTGIVLGYAEILIRDDKPYGVSEEIEYTVKLLTPFTEEEIKEMEEEEQHKASSDMFSEGAPIYS